ncbi:replication-associated recombination protein A [Bacillus sp. JJ664]
MSHEPLAYRMRPRTIDELIGQEQIIGKESALYRLIQNGRVPSMLIHGEPGIGKTSFAYAIAGTVDKRFVTVNATTSGKKELEDIVHEAKMFGEIILFADEIHRWSKLQQDYLLSYVESGFITLIGATTENPYHDVNSAIRSRCNHILKLDPLLPKHIYKLLDRALRDEDRGLGNLQIQISEEQILKIAHGVNGDARSSLNILESIVFGSPKESDGTIIVQDEIIEEFLRSKGFNHDKNGDFHYDTLSGFQKSIRGSDVNAALYYLARLIEAGDLTSICRRLTVIAYEDIGLAGDPWKVVLACEAAKQVGFPEARIILSNTVIELCLSSKSNSSVLAIDRALGDVRSGLHDDIPAHLKDSHYAGAKDMGHGIGYVYPHDHPLGNFGGWVNQQYLPDRLVNQVYYKPKEAGNEKRYGAIFEKLEQFKKVQKKES